MLPQFDAIYSDGVLKPLTPLALGENERVTVSVFRSADEEWLDSAFMDRCGADADPSVTHTEVRAAMGKVKGSMDEAVAADRGEF